MKSYVVLILLGLTVACATLLHSTKHKQPNEINDMARSLSAVKSIVPSGAALSFKGEPAKGELLPWARYILAPRYLDITGQFDTTLSIGYLHNGDSALLAFSSGRNIIWQYSDERYYYSLSTAQ